MSVLALSATLFVPYTTLVDRDLGILEVNVDSFISNKQLVAPAGTSHFRFISAAAAINFDTGEFLFGQSASDSFLLDSGANAGLTLTNNMGAGLSGYPLFLCFGIEFLQEVNGEYYTLNNGAYNALSVVLVAI